MANIITVNNSTVIGGMARNASANLKNTLNDIRSLKGKLNAALESGNGHAETMTKINTLAGTTDTAKAQELFDTISQFLDFFDSPGSGDTITKDQAATAFRKIIDNITG